MNWNRILKQLIVLFLICVLFIALKVSIGWNFDIVSYFAGLTVVWIME
jgi:hypothetical protein